MDDFFKFFEVNFVGLSIFLCFFLCMVFLIDWLAKIFAIGRYKNSPSNQNSNNVVFILSQFLVKIITDFRHFLALVLVLIFAIALGYASYLSAKSGANKIENFIKVLQAVVATLGGLIGSIVGYYFGESAAKSARESDQTSQVTQKDPPLQSDSLAEVEPMN